MRGLINKWLCLLFLVLKATVQHIQYISALALPPIITSGSRITCDPLITTQRDNNQRWQQQGGNPLLSHSSTDVLLSSLLSFEVWQDDICSTVLGTTAKASSEEHHIQSKD